MLLQKIGSAVRSHKIDRVLVDIFTSTDSGFAQVMHLKKFQSIGIVSVTKEFDVKFVGSCLVHW